MTLTPLEIDFLTYVSNAYVFLFLPLLHLKSVVNLYLIYLENVFLKYSQ